MSSVWYDVQELHVHVHVAFKIAVMQFFYVHVMYLGQVKCNNTCIHVTKSDHYCQTKTIIQNIIILYIEL